MPSSLSDMSAESFEGRSVAIDTTGAPADRAGSTDSACEMPNSTSPEATAWSAPACDGSMISTLRPASSYHPFSCAA
jgi:hypothetical protein